MACDDPWDSVPGGMVPVWNEESEIRFGDDVYYVCPPNSASDGAEEIKITCSNAAHPNGTYENVPPVWPKCTKSEEGEAAIIQRPQTV